MVVHCSANAKAFEFESNLVRIPLKPRKTFFRVISQLLKMQFTVMVTYSFHLYSRNSHNFISVFQSFHGLMNSINWPAPSVWVFMVQLVGTNTEVTDLNPIEAPRNFFGGYSVFRNCLHVKCDSLQWSHIHFSCIPAVHIISFLNMKIWAPSTLVIFAVPNELTRYM